MMKKLIIFFVSIAVFAGFVCAAEVLPLQQTQTIILPNVEGRIDHFDIDQANQRLFVAALGNNTLEVVDLRSAKPVHTITGLDEPQGVVFVPQIGRIYVSNGRSGKCDIFDANSFRLVSSLKFSNDADNMRYDPKAGLIYVGFGSAIGIIDVNSNKIIGTVNLDNHPESFQLEKKGQRIFVNIPSARQIVVLDKIKRSVIETWPLEDVKSNFPMALDETNHRLYIGCRQPNKLLVLDSSIGKRLTAIDINGDADDIFWDSAKKRIYISCGEGFIDVIEQTDPTIYTLIAKIPTAKGARTSFFLPESSRFYLAVPKQTGHSAQIYVYETFP